MVGDSRSTRSGVQRPRLPRFERIIGITDKQLNEIG